MADPTLTGRFLILLGNGATPTETFAFPCAANARSLQFTNSYGQQTLLDCTNPLDGGVWVHRFLESQDTTANISGRLAVESMEMWRQWADGAAVKNIRLFFDETLARKGGHYSLKAVLGSLEINAEGDGKGGATLTASLMGTGARVWTPAAA